VGEVIMGIFEGLDMTVDITEKIEFGTFDSKNRKMYLISRTAPTPAKNDISESVPFMNGVYDFSRILGEDSYQNRPLTYVFHVYEGDKSNRKHNQTVIENELMRLGITEIHDTYDPNYYYLGKCVSVSTDDDHRYGRLIITIEFDCYPFKVANEPEGNDIWDIFNFDLDYAQDTEYEVNGSRSITLYNAGIPSVVPEITVDGEITVSNGQRQTTITNGTFKNESFRLMPGENTLTLDGQGTISFYFYKELI
jgi:phage-related protein